MSEVVTILKYKIQEVENDLDAALFHNNCRQNVTSLRNALEWITAGNIKNLDKRAIMSVISVNISAELRKIKGCLHELNSHWYNEQENNCQS